jgi:hypothetical protein
VCAADGLGPLGAAPTKESRLDRSLTLPLTTNRACPGLAVWGSSRLIRLVKAGGGPILKLCGHGRAASESSKEVSCHLSPLSAL